MKNLTSPTGGLTPGHSPFYARDCRKSLWLALILALLFWLIQSKAPMAFLEAFEFTEAKASQLVSYIHSKISDEAVTAQLPAGLASPQTTTFQLRAQNLKQYRLDEAREDGKNARETSSAAVEASQSLQIKKSASLKQRATQNLLKKAKAKLQALKVNRGYWDDEDAGANGNFDVEMVNIEALEQNPKARRLLKEILSELETDQDDYSGYEGQSETHSEDGSEKFMLKNQKTMKKWNQLMEMVSSS